MEALGDFEIRQIRAQRDVCGGHHWRVTLSGIVRIGHGGRRGRLLRRPLIGAGGALGQHPLIAKQGVEVAVIPLNGIRCPGPFESARGGMHSLAAAESILPAESLLFDGRALGLRADELRIARTMRLTEGVAARDQRHRFFVVHGHALERLANVARRGERIRHAVRPFGIHVDESHLHGGQRILEFAITRVALVAQPFGFDAPVNVGLGLPHIGAPTGEAEGREPHRLHADVGNQDHEIGPGDLLAVLLLDRPEQATGFVEVAVVGPAVERRKTLRAIACTAAAIGRAVGASAVPGHTHKERAVVTVVGGPPVLRVGHERDEILAECLKVERLEGLRVIELRVHRVGERGVLVQDA